MWLLPWPLLLPGPTSSSARSASVSLSLSSLALLCNMSTLLVMLVDARRGGGVIFSPEWYFSVLKATRVFFLVYALR